MSNGSFTLHTEHGLISVSDTALKSDAPALLLIHGNSSSSKIWRHIQASKRITERYRVVAFDLPGHGASGNAPYPNQSYSMRGYADLAVYILEHLCIKSVVVIGWSLGGHTGIEMIPLLPSHDISMKGLMLIGTPPALGKEQINRGFMFKDPHLSFSAQLHWTLDEAKDFSRTSAGEPFEQWMEECAIRTDGKSRLLMWRKLADGVGLDQRKTVEEDRDVLIAVVNGGAEPYVNLDYLDEIAWGKLWKGKCLRLEGLKHAPFWERPTMFEEILEEFLEDCAKA
ncbi:alpha/beta-hydrolase [Trematosphaeria pertusa]|uniref:Alpha/beta-hydrolase n=1 Tax=Trematosphaeria pertusa TaxID=390896 RepID=A0A6A6I1U1_9PLEO|nr:alpha/beta-hydrolase [Trematosphaeria pertusa]KAF2243978.1 alpha/beta-hydrolase [Trematosphaeria pertusa]